MTNALGASFSRLASTLFFPLSFFVFSLAQADVEPPLENLVTNYFISDVEGQGNVKILKEGESLWQKVEKGARLEEGDRISVGDDTEVILSLKSETLVHLDEGTEMTVSQLVENHDKGFLSRLTLLGGAVLSDVKKHLFESDSKFEVDAGGVVCGVRGTIFETSINNGQVQTSTDEGLVEVHTSNGSRQVGAGQTCSATKGGLPSVRRSNAQTLARFHNWRSCRQRLLHNRGLKGKPGARVSNSITAHPGGQRMGHNPAAGGGHGGAHGGFHAGAHAFGGHR